MCDDDAVNARALLFDDVLVAGGKLAACRGLLEAGERGGGIATRSEIDSLAGREVLTAGRSSTSDARCARSV